jgi:peroxiredoxin
VTRGSKTRTSTLLILVLLAAWTLSSPALAQVDQAAPPAADELVIDGIVVTPVGSGISGAEVRIESPDAAASDPPLAESVTGNRGQIAITLKKPGVKELRYRIVSEGFAPHVGTIDISDPDEPPFIDATLQGAASISGTVTSADERPVADAKVRCENGGRRLTAETGPDGKYEFDSVYFGPARLTATAPGFGTRRDEVMVEEESYSLDFEMQAERPIILTIVTNTGSPAKDVLVEALTEPLQIHVSTTSDENGKATLSGVDLDSTGLSLRFNGEAYLAMRGYDEFLELPGGDGQEKTTATQPAAIEKQFEVTLAGRIRGKVTDKQTGKPVHNVRVLAGREPRYDMPMDWSGPAGGYELIGVRPGVIIVTFQHDDYATAFHSVDLDTGRTSTLDVALEGGVPVGGVVVDDQNVPVDQVRVAADRWDEYETLGLRAITDGKGRFLFPHAPAGEIEFTFVRPGYGKPMTVTLATGKTDHVVTLESVAVPLTSGAAPIDEAKLKPGEAVADLSLTTTDGTTYKLSELRGKYVFLDCWASWCRPCMVELPNIKALHEATKGRADFVLIGISLDTDAKALKKASEENGITWPQVFGPKSGASEAFEELDGVGIPYTCLIGPDGKLIAQHLRGPALGEQVKKLLASAASQPSAQ